MSHELFSASGLLRFSLNLTPSVAKIFVSDSMPLWQNGETPA